MEHVILELIRSVPFFVPLFVVLGINFASPFCASSPAMQDPPGLTAILLIAHGSRQRSANDDLHELAARLAGQGAYPIVEASFLELAEPGVDRRRRPMCRARRKSCADDPLLPVGRRSLAT